MPVHGPNLLVSAIALCIECYGDTSGGSSNG